MTGARAMQPSFAGGELDPMLNARIDAEVYKYGLETCENFAAINEGPLVKRPGFEYICDADPTSTWLGAFRFSTTQEYVLEFGEEKIRFYTNGGRIETTTDAGTAVYEVTLPYAAAEASALSTQQSYDRLYIDHPSYPPGCLVRESATTFSYAVSSLLNGPFLDDNSDEDVKVSAAGTFTVNGVVTLTCASSGTATAEIFSAGDVGGLFRIEAYDFSDIKAWDASSSGITVGEYCRSDSKAYSALTDGPCGTITPTHDSGAEWDGSRHGHVGDNSDETYGVLWQYEYDRYGIVQITDFLSTTQVKGTVLRRLPSSLSTVPTDDWAFGAFSPGRGYPSIVVHTWGRQVHIKDFDIYGSVSGDYGGGRVNFQTLTSSDITADDLGFRRTLATEDPVLWATADRKLLIGTASRELMVGPLNGAAAVSGDNIDSEVQSFYGSEDVTPLQVGTTTIFIERGARRIRAAGYDLGSDRYVPQDLTASARHITSSGIVQMAYERFPHGLVLGARADGQIIAHADTRDDIKGFSRYVLGGSAQALSIVSVVGADGKTDEVWALITRTTPTGTAREIWRQTAWRELGDAQQEAFFVDCGTRAAATAGQTHFTGATHLAGQTAVALVGGGVVRNIAVAADGSFDLPAGAVPAEAYTLIVGLPYTATATTLRPDMRTDAGTSQGRKQKIGKLTLRVLETFGLTGGAFGRSLEAFITRPYTTAMTDPTPLQSGDFGQAIDATFEEGGRVTFVSADPLPAIITAATIRGEVDERDV